MKFLTKILIFSFLLIFVSNGILSADEMLVRRFGNTGTKLGIIGINVGTYESNDKSAFKKALREGACFINTSPFVEGIVINCLDSAAGVELCDGHSRSVIHTEPL